MSCSTTTAAALSANDLTSATVASVSSVVMPAVGSSSRNSFGRVIRHKPISSHCFLPWGRVARLLLGLVDKGNLLEHQIYVVAAITDPDSVACDAEILANGEVGKDRGRLKLPRDAGAGKVVHRTPAEISALERNFACI